MSTSTTGDHERYREWDGAYVLGALSASERAEYEQHLGRCAECARAVAELAPVPGLLARVAEEERAALLDGDPVPDPPLPTGLEGRIRAAAEGEVQAQERGRHLRVRRRRIALAAAAAAVVAVGVAVPTMVDHRDSSVQVAPNRAITLRSTTPSPLSAQVTLTTVAWGTRIAMTCLYADDGSGWTGSRAYGLYLVDDAGAAHLVSSWHAAPGQTARTAGSTALPISRLAKVELRAADGTTVLLSAPV